MRRGLDAIPLKGFTMRITILLFGLLAITLCPVAFGGLSQIGVHFQAQNAPIAPTNVTGPGCCFSGNYLIFIYATQNPVSIGCGVSNLVHTLAWTDERGNVNMQSVTTPKTDAGSGTQASMVIPVHTLPGTVPTVSTSGTFALGADTAACVGSKGTYGLYVDGLGFWATQPQKQAGIIEHKVDIPVSNGQKVVLVTNQPASYFVALLSRNTSNTVLHWSDEYGSQSSNGGQVGDQGFLQPLRMAYGATSQVFVTVGAAGSGATRVAAAAVKFGTPGNGAGPLTDYESQETDLPFLLNVGFNLGANSELLSGFYALTSITSSSPQTGSVGQVVGEFGYANGQDLPFGCGIALGSAAGTGTGLASHGTTVCPIVPVTFPAFTGWQVATFPSHVGLPSAISWSEYDNLLLF